MAKKTGRKRTPLQKAFWRCLDDTGIVYVLGAVGCRITEGEKYDSVSRPTHGLPAQRSSER